MYIVIDCITNDLSAEIETQIPFNFYKNWHLKLIANV